MSLIDINLIFFFQFLGIINHNNKKVKRLNMFIIRILSLHFIHKCLNLITNY